MKRDKTVSIKINSELYFEFQQILATKNHRWKYAKGYRQNDIDGRFGMYSFADFVTDKVREFVKSNTNTSNEK
jgi:hypothetical protein